MLHQITCAWVKLEQNSRSLYQSWMATLRTRPNHALNFKTSTITPLAEFAFSVLISHLLLDQILSQSDSPS